MPEQKSVLDESLRLFKRSRIVHLFFAVAFFTSGLIINFLQFLAFVTVKPFSIKKYRQLMYYICYFLNSRELSLDLSIFIAARSTTNPHSFQNWCSSAHGGPPQK